MITLIKYYDFSFKFYRNEDVKVNLIGEIQNNIRYKLTGMNEYIIVIDAQKFNNFIESQVGLIKTL